MRKDGCGHGVQGATPQVERVRWGSQSRPPQASAGRVGCAPARPRAVTHAQGQPAEPAAHAQPGGGRLRMRGDNQRGVRDNPDKGAGRSAC
ncbi:hypothetical protein Kpho01_73320 [Kitasatospora phosalacinea]|uniref:Uncharacterized protein n=1 Tax=Kitasatospora phosalacinea TaxID=2065 RepID=A0A9W6UTP0_9ACTN|nr:hypothetical protein Kpho01_73320 [Kitasatospora phosalacinea]